MEFLENYAYIEALKVKLRKLPSNSRLNEKIQEALTALDKFQNSAQKETDLSICLAAIQIEQLIELKFCN